MLAHLPTQHGFPLDEPGFPFGKVSLPLGELGFALLQRAVPLPLLRVFREVSRQLLLDEVDEKIDFLLVITALADSRPRERDIMDISRSESHCSSPGVADIRGHPMTGVAA